MLKTVCAPDKPPVPKRHSELQRAACRRAAGSWCRSGCCCTAKRRAGLRGIAAGEITGLLHRPSDRNPVGRQAVGGGLGRDAVVRGQAGRAYRTTLSSFISVPVQTYVPLPSWKSSCATGAGTHALLPEIAVHILRATTPPPAGGWQRPGIEVDVRQRRHRHLDRVQAHRAAPRTRP